MAERTKEQIAKMTPVEVAFALRLAFEFEKTHKAITWEHGTDLVNICALHGDMLADALETR